MTLRITIPESPSDADREAVVAPLRVFNMANAGDPHYRPVAILLTDHSGADVGGLWGKCVYNWLFVELLAISKEHRGAGYGKRLIGEAERIARANGCIGLWLDTYEFQARDFYEKLGFQLFGTLEDHPIGHNHFFLRKRFADG